MNTRLCTIKLSVKDYTSKEYGSFVYHGEVVGIDEDLKQYYYKFYETDAGTLSVTIDFSKEVLSVNEINDSVKLMMQLEKNKIHHCQFSYDPQHKLVLETKAVEIKTEDGNVNLEYDLFDPSDIYHLKPITRNKVEIKCEANKVC